jgi:hypothetical protein
MGGTSIDSAYTARMSHVAGLKSRMSTGNGKGTGRGSGNRYDPIHAGGVKAQNAETIAATQVKAAALSLAAQDTALDQDHEDAKAANEKQIAEQEALNAEGVMQVDDLRAGAADKALTAISESVVGDGRPPEAPPPVEA